MSQPFDPLAPTYDHEFTHSPVARLLRERVHRRLERHFQPGIDVLELGCGTGEDALHLAGLGVRVTATDVSESMLHLARAKAAGNPLIEFHHLDLRNLDANSSICFDGTFSNFGPLNCLEDWRPLAAWLADRVKPGGVVAFGVMSPFCLWEILWHGIHGDFKTAFRRWRQDTTFQADPTSPPIPIRYPTLRRLTRDFSPHFRRTHVEGIGLFLPPSDAFGVVEKRPHLLHRLSALERQFAPIPLLALLADHYWIEFERVTG